MRIDDWLRREKEEAGRQIALFVATLKETPGYAFEWGDRAALAAAILEMTGAAQEAREAGRSQDEILEWARKEVVRRASQPSRSTSSYSNLMEQFRLQAWAKLVDAAQWWGPEDDDH